MQWFGSHVVAQEDGGVTCMSQASRLALTTDAACELHVFLHDCNSTHENER